MGQQPKYGRRILTSLIESAIERSGYINSLKELLDKYARIESETILNKYLSKQIEELHKALTHLRFKVQVMETSLELKGICKDGSIIWPSRYEDFGLVIDGIKDCNLTDFDRKLASKRATSTTVYKLYFIRLSTLGDIVKETIKTVTENRKVLWMPLTDILKEVHEGVKATILDTIDSRISVNGMQYFPALKLNTDRLKEWLDQTEYPRAINSDAWKV